jgi:hypothetical protein
VDEFIEWLLAHGDPRVRRWNATTEREARTRGASYERLVGTTAEFGRLATRINKAGPKPKELGQHTEDEIRRMRAARYSLRRIELALGGDATLKQIRRVLGRGG